LKHYFQMANYKGRKPGTRRIVLWVEGRSREWVIQGTKADGEQFAAKKRLELEAAKQSQRSDPTFSEFCAAEYRPHAETHLKESTWKKVRIYQLATLIEFFGRTRLSKFSAAESERYKRNRLQDVKPSAVNNELRVLGTVLRFAGSLGYVVGQFKTKRVPERGKGRVAVWSTEQLQALFAAAQQEYPPLFALFLFLANTGCRKGEAIAAKWSWIDQHEKLLRIPSNDYWQPKNGLPREVPLSDSLLALLEQLPRASEYLFPNRYNQRYVVFPQDIWTRVRAAAGVPGSPHRFRHTFASHFLAATHDLKLLSEVMGHSLGRVTELYTHLLPGHLARARNAVDVGKTMVATMAATPKTAESPKKTKKRH
jgi:integrase